MGPLKVSGLIGSCLLCLMGNPALLEGLKDDFNSRHDHNFTLSSDLKEETQSLKDGGGSFSF